jgi:hypothetical protein
MTQRYRAYLPTDARLLALMPLATGGYLIHPDGKVTAVADCCHYRALERRYGGHYGTAYEAGAIRVSFCGGSYAFITELVEQHAALPALQVLRRLMRLHTERTSFDLTLDGGARDEPMHNRTLAQALATVNRVIKARMADSAAAKAAS